MIKVTDVLLTIKKLDPKNMIETKNLQAQNIKNPNIFSSVLLDESLIYFLQKRVEVLNYQRNQLMEQRFKNYFILISPFCLIKKTMWLMITICIY